MRYFLAKTEPGTYSVGDLRRDRRTVWDGVRNPQALRAIGEMRPGDRVFIYHSGGESAIVGLARVASKPRADAADPRLTVVDLEFERLVEPPVTLREVKAAGSFADWALERQGRLSTMAVPEPFLDWLRGRGLDFL
jgi:predicted RNA-binding protein with PUA-like domain